MSRSQQALAIVKSYSSSIQKTVFRFFNQCLVFKTPVSKESLERELEFAFNSYITWNEGGFKKAANDRAELFRCYEELLGLF